MENDLIENFFVFLEYFYSSDCDLFFYVYGIFLIFRLYVMLIIFDLMRVGSVRLVVRILKMGFYIKVIYW